MSTFWRYQGISHPTESSVRDYNIYALVWRILESGFEDRDLLIPVTHITFHKLDIFTQLSNGFLSSFFAEIANSDIRSNNDKLGFPKQCVWLLTLLQEMLWHKLYPIRQRLEILVLITLQISIIIRHTSSDNHRFVL